MISPRKSAGTSTWPTSRKKSAKTWKTYLKRLSRVKTERALLDKLVELNPLEVPKGVVKRHSQEMCGAEPAADGREGAGPAGY